jgi:hypothetical protein
VEFFLGKFGAGFEAQDVGSFGFAWEVVGSGRSGFWVWVWVDEEEERKRKRGN